MGPRAFVIALLLAASSTAIAEDRVAAKQAFEDGQKYYNLNQFADALEAFKKAYWNYPEPTFLYNIAQCHRLLKHKSDAVEFYKSYLRNAPSTPRRAEVQRLIGDLEAAIAKEQTATNAPPLGTATTSPPTTSPPTTSGAATATRSPPAANTAPPVAADPGASSTARADLVASAPAPGERRERPVWKRGWFWGVVGGAAAVAVGVGLGVGLGTSSSLKDPSPSFGSVKVN